MIPRLSAAAPETAAAPAQFGLPFITLCIYTFVLIGRPQDYVTALTPLRLALVFTLLTITVTLLRAGATTSDVFRQPETKAYLVFYAAMIWGIPFAVYRPGAFDFAIMQYVVNVAFFLLFLIHVDTVPKLKRIAVVLVFSIFVFTFFSLQYGQFTKGRYVNGILMFDPNDIAFVEVSLLGFALWVLVGSFGFVTKALAFASVLAGVLLTLYTASRGGLLGLLTFLLLFLWLRVPKVGKLFKVVMLAAVLIVAAANSDKINIDRYMTLTSLEGDYNFEEGGRTDIWKRGVRLFMAAPLTGTGVNTFGAAIGFMRQDEGVIPRWQTAHSAYLLVLTELGIFGTAAFLYLIIRCLRTLNRLRRRGATFQDRDFGVLPGLLLIGFAAQLVSAAFLSQAYSMFFTLAFAMSGVLNRIAPKADAPLEESERPVVVPAPFARQRVTAWRRS